MTSVATKRISGACLAVAAAAVVAGCDGSAGFSPPDEEAAGVYTGTLNADVGGVPTTIDLAGMISGNNNLQMVAPGGDFVVGGPVTVSQTKFDADLVVYVGESGHFYGMDGLDQLILDGHLTAQTGADGNFYAPGVQGTFGLTYELLSGEFASLEFTEGTWTYNDGGYSSTLTIDSAGLVTGSDSTGCTFSGQVAVVDVSQNVYEVAMVVTNCGMYDGDYAGVVSLASVGGVEFDEMSLGMSNDLTAYSVTLDKT